MSQEANDYEFLFETSWEVCNKVGGIFTVLSTKAKTLQLLFGDKLVFIGPDLWSKDNPSPYFKETPRRLTEWRKQVSLPYGITVRVGYWDIPGKPTVVLVGFRNLLDKDVKDQLYAEMWQQFHVDSLHAYGDYDESCAFSYASAIVISDIVRFYKPADAPGRIIAHFDEWTTGMGLLGVKQLLPNAATVFTTHATSIGRSICSNGKPLYDYLHNYNGDQMAGELNMESKHSLEKIAAHQADAFTTVSGITADECEQLLDIRPYIVTPNGFEPGFVPARRVFDARRNEARRVLCNVASLLAGHEYNPNNTFIMATSGRCEYRNKGIDLFLDSARCLSDLHPDRKVLAFVMVPAWCAGPRADLKAAVDGGAKPSKPMNEPYLSHSLHNPDSDAILAHIRRLGFNNAEGDNVSVVYVPCYLNGNDGIFNMSYYDLLIGLDATVFPSYYEPWGYTPLESVAFGVPTVTTSLSGFGRWILDNYDNRFEDCGVHVVPRNDSNYSQACERIAQSVNLLIDAPKADRETISKAARATAAAASWKNFIIEYLVAYRKASDNARCRAELGHKCI